MSNLTLNQTIAIFEDIASRHKQLEDFGTGPSYQIGNVRKMNYPYLWVTLQPSNVIKLGAGNKLREVDLNVTLILADQLSNVISDERGEESTNGLEVTSDLQSVLFDIVSEVNNHPFYRTNRIMIKSDVSFSPSFDEKDDSVNAIVADLTITMPFNHTYCDSPSASLTDRDLNNC